MSEARVGYDAAKVLTIVLGAIGSLLTAGVIMILGLLFSLSERVSELSGSISANREERLQQLRMQDSRIDRLEGIIFNGSRRTSEPN